MRIARARAYGLRRGSSVGFGRATCFESCGKRSTSVRQSHRRHEMLLEAGFGGDLDLLDAPDLMLDRDPRASPSSSAATAPVPAAFPADETRASAQSGIMPSSIAYFTSIWLPKAPASRIRSSFSMPRWSISKRAPA